MSLLDLEPEKVTLTRFQLCGRGYRQKKLHEGCHWLLSRDINTYCGDHLITFNMMAELKPEQPIIFHITPTFTYNITLRRLKCDTIKPIYIQTEGELDALESPQYLEDYLYEMMQKDEVYVEDVYPHSNKYLLFKNLYVDELGEPSKKLKRVL